MKKKLEREVAKLEEEATQKLEAEVFRVFERYGNNAANLSKYASEYEKDLVFRWGYPKAVAEFMELFKVFGPVVFRVAFEKLIYPCVLSDNPKEENEDIVSGIDLSYLELVYPRLWKRLKGEIKEMLKLYVDSEEYGNSRISEALKKKFDEARAERDKLKNDIREKMRREEEEDQKKRERFMCFVLGL